MQKNIFLLLVLFLFSGCAERGYKLTHNSQTKTAIAQQSINTNASSSSKKINLMNTAVKSALKHPKNKSIQKRPVHMSIPYEETQVLTSSTEDLLLNRENTLYQKFGNSEIHGHVIYLSEHDVEIRLQNTHIYLLHKSPTLNHWYANAYLKNQHLAHTPKVKYLNDTHLNMSQNFAFHGIAPGNYYVIIISDKPNSENQKVYIAKEIEVQKHKKIMAVFSKKL